MLVVMLKILYSADCTLSFLLLFLLLLLLSFCVVVVCEWAESYACDLHLTLHRNAALSILG